MQKDTEMNCEDPEFGALWGVWEPAVSGNWRTHPNKRIEQYRPRRNWQSRRLCAVRTPAYENMLHSRLNRGWWRGCM